jgi:hypothetical protein
VAVVSMMRMQGDADELAASIRENVTPVARALAEKHGGLFNIVARAPDGILAINLWESEEGRQAMAAEPEIQQALQAAGLPAPNFEGYEVLDLNITDRLAAQTTASS